MTEFDEQIDDLLAAYIDANFQQELIPVIASSFSILERFSVPYYEDRFIDLLTTADLVSSDDMRDLFIQNLRGMLIDLLKSHAVELDLEMEPTLPEINEVLFFLLLAQDLEDTSQMSYRLNGFGSARTKFIDLLVYYSTLSQIRAMEIIESVSEGLIMAMLKMCSDNELSTQVDQVHRNYWADFQKFTGGVACLGLSLKNKGFFGLSVRDTLALSGVDLASHLESVILTSPAQAALDLLSLLLLCKDSYQTPLVYMEANSGAIFHQLDTTTKLRALTSHILGDFGNMLEAIKSQANS